MQKPLLLNVLRNLSCTLLRRYRFALDVAQSIKCNSPEIYIISESFRCSRRCENQKLILPCAMLYNVASRKLGDNSGRDFIHYATPRATCLKGALHEHVHETRQSQVCDRMRLRFFPSFSFFQSSAAENRVQEINNQQSGSTKTEGTQNHFLPRLLSTNTKKAR